MTLEPASSPELPQEVITCLKNARYLHLATTGGLWPHVSLMNYTFLPSNPHSINGAPPGGPVIILTVQHSTKKINNLLANPRVSLLVHDWVSHRAPLGTSTTITTTEDRPRQSSLASLLTNLNSAELSSISATLFGHAHLIPQGSEYEQFYRQLHTESCVGSGESMCYLEGEDARIVVVTISWTRVADYKGLVKDWVKPGEEKAWEEFENDAVRSANGA
ncbi:hypothetical protein FN846DRAFT_896904 [Sphaerosporella brunnea]|uniref:Pyridoxamine 5'-phosphate oxidase N-terminal domain-containing protein n=1 Tax=Sphaerosporella brunnea TaxID=1250544 RepID=A0A5J5FAQ9_9PEZI|nr:hypothetical protein FN846DRAFT_896904 [Sphaerosporella brunnea]